MKKINFGVLFFSWVAPVLVLACAGWFVYAMGAREKPKRKKAPPRKSIPVEVVQAKPHTTTLDIVASGVVIPHREVQISTRVGGEVIFKSDLLSPGQYVNKDDLLLRIDPTDYELEVARLEQALAQVDVDLERLKVDKENAQRLLKINREIVQLRRTDGQRFARLRTANAASATEIDTVQLSLLTAMEKVTENENQLRGFDSQAKSLEMSRELASLQLKRAKLDLARTEIFAPFSGVVIANHAEQDSNVGNNAMVATIEDTSMVEVRCSLSADEMEFVCISKTKTDGEVPSAAQGKAQENEPSSLASPAPTPQNTLADAYRLPPVPVTIESQRGGQTFQWAGVLSRQDGLGVDQNTRTVPVRILIDNPTQNISNSLNGEQRQLALVRGMFVKVKFHCQPQTPLMVIPESVLRPGKTVWIKRDDKLHIEPIRITRIEEGQTYFELGKNSLASGDQIISSPVPNAKTGLAVSLKGQGKPRGGKKADGPEAANEKKLANHKIKPSGLKASSKPGKKKQAQSQ